MTAIKGLESKAAALESEVAAAEQAAAGARGAARVAESGALKARGERDGAVAQAKQAEDLRWGTLLCPLFLSFFIMACLPTTLPLTN